MAKKRGLRSKTARKQESPRNLLVDAVVVFGIVVSLGLIAVSVALNYRMGFRSADTALDGKLYGAGAACGDCLKAIAPFMASWGLRQGDWLAVVSAAFLFAICSTYSFVSSLGFAAEHRASKAGEAQTQVDGYGDARKERKRLEDALVLHGPQRSSREVEDAIAAKLKERVWSGGRTISVVSNDCTVDRKSTRAACEAVAHLKVELAASEEVERLSKALRGLSEAPNVAAMTSDAQVDVLADLVGLVTDVVVKDHVGLVLSILLACFIEVGSGVGLFMVTTPWRTKEGKDEAKPTSSKRALGHVDAYMLARIEPGVDMLSDNQLHEDYVRWCMSGNVVPYAQGEFSKRFSVLALEAGIESTTRVKRVYYRQLRLAV